MKASFFPSRFSQIAALILLLTLGLGIRLYDLTDLPLDFHPTRQLLSALKARGMYYETLTDVPAEQRSFAIQQWKFRAAIEPEVIERLTAFTYQFTGEQLWIARIYSSLFWVIGAVFLFLLARRLTSADGALAATAFFLFAPYAVTASRSFQPDPLMVALIVVFWWAVSNWAGEPTSYKWAVIAGLFGGLAIYVKFVAAFFVIAGGLGSALRRDSLRDVVRRPQIYVMALLGILTGAAYVVYGVWVAGFLGQQFGGRFIADYFLSPSYYLGWIGMLNLVIGGTALTMSLLGLFFFEIESRRFALGLWAGYFIFGLYFNYHISSHDYYSLPLIPVVALSLAPLAEWLFSQLNQLTASRFARLAAYGFLLLGLFATLWNLRAEMKRVDYRPEAAMWAEIGELLGDRNVAGLTQDYGSRLSYWGWKNHTPWQTYGDVVYHADLRGADNDFEGTFADVTSKKELFLVTDFDELKRQPLLKEKLSGYPIFAKGDGYVIYDLTSTDSHKMPNSTKLTSKLFNFSLWLIAAFSGSVLVVYAYLGTFSRHLADDYCAIDFLSTDFPTALWVNYLNVSDRFSNFMLITLSEAIGPWTVSILPALMLALWVFGIAWLMFESSRFSGRAWEKLLIATLTFLLVFLVLLQAPNRFQILYWRSSMAAHFAPLVFMPYLAVYILRLILAAEKKPTAFWTPPLLFLASFILGGFSEPTVMVMISLLALGIFCVWLWMKGSARKTALILFMVSFLGEVSALAVMAIAPAREFRLQNAAPPPIPVAFARGFDYGFEFILNSFRTLPLPTFFTILIPFLIFYGLYAAPAVMLNSGQRKRIYLLLAAIPILSYLLIVASFLPSAYGQSFPVERARFTGQLCLVTGLMIESALMGSLAAQFRSRITEVIPFKLIVSLLLMLSSLYLLRAVWVAMTDVPTYRQRAEWWDMREEMIYQSIEQGQTDLIVQQFDGVDGVKEMDVSENHWVNRCAAKYYGVKSIRAYPDVMFP